MQTITGYEYNGFAIPEEEAMKKLNMKCGTTMKINRMLLIIFGKL